MKKERTWSSMNLRQNGMIIALIVIILGLWHCARRYAVPSDEHQQHLYAEQL